jgi:hypothetical protein
MLAHPWSKTVDQTFPPLLSTIVHTSIYVAKQHDGVNPCQVLLAVAPPPFDPRWKAHLNYGTGFSPHPGALQHGKKYPKNNL